MKNKVLRFVIVTFTFFSLVSCVDYLNQTPDSVAFNEEQVFSDYTKSLQFIDQLYVPYTYFDDNDVFNNKTVGGFHGKRIYGLREAITDNCIPNQGSNWHPKQPCRWGNFQADWAGNDLYFNEASELRFKDCWRAIRICNLSIANIDRLTNATPEQKDLILGNAYFLKGHFYFQLLQGWGGMPFLEEPLAADANMDLPRLSYTETAQKIAETFELASQHLLITVPDNSWGRPSKMAALAYKAKALLWAASPFSNPTNDQTLWANAAVEAGKAIQAAEASGYYALAPFSEFHNLFIGPKQSSYKEILFGRIQAAINVTWTPVWIGIQSDMLGGSWNGAESVTENLAQCYGWADGSPIDPTSSKYLTDPYTGRDPRFYQTIMYNGATNSLVSNLSRTVQIWNESYDNSIAKELKITEQKVALNGYTYTGYYEAKLCDPVFNISSSSKSVTMIWNIIRLADLYLYYAEAANRAWGPNAAPQGIAEFTLTSAQAVNMVRARAGMPLYDGSKAWLLTGNTDEFEQKIRNEIRIETAFEEKRYYDLRRWRIMLNPEVLVQKGMYIKKTAATSFQYTIVTCPENLQLKWQERHYLFPIPRTDVELGPNFKQNPGW
ncbi:MAG: RagB/SusD family nutrient uptake outer membrane protein [Bacteroidia bacterium]|nr:RagB/SusD family nutrient uptake outer membrane protein [Bacteroidia bacterium]